MLKIIVHVFTALFKLGYAFQIKYFNKYLHL